MGVPLWEKDLKHFLNHFQDDQMVAQLQIESFFPKEITVDEIALSFEAQTKGSADARRIENP